jgi:Ni/Co efflux regulator RcnB
MRKIILATVATVVLAAPIAASAEEVTVRDHPNGAVTVREHARPPRDNVVIRDHPNGNVVVRDHVYDRWAPRRDNLVIKDRVAPRGDSLTIKDR